MIGRREFTMAGLSAALTAVGSHAFAQGDSRRGRENYDKCAEACSACQRNCDYCATHCAELLAEGHKQHLATLQTCRDCADICAAAAQIVAREGVMARTICEACANACAQCAKACEQHGRDDKTMRECAEQCRHCEKACRDMLATTGRGTRAN